MIRATKSRLKPKKGDIVMITSDVVAHYYPLLMGPGEWYFANVGDSFVVIENFPTNEKYSEWKNVLSVSNDGTIVVLTYSSTKLPGYALL